MKNHSPSSQANRLSGGLDDHGCAWARPIP
jgi:hypothetical protein